MSLTRYDISPCLFHFSWSVGGASRAFSPFPADQLRLHKAIVAALEPPPKNKGGKEGGKRHRLCAIL